MMSPNIVLTRIGRITLAVVATAAVSWSSVAPAGQGEMRGVWMHPKEIKSRAETDQSVARIEAANLNSVFILVWYHGGQASFKSELCPMADDVQPGHDPLGYLIQECHRRKIEVHAWFVNGNYGAPRPKYVLDRHPDWAVDGDQEGLWYDLGKPEVRKFQSDLMIEALQKYDLDGLHFDYIRYDGPAICYCKHCQEEFAARSGHAPILPQDRKTFPVITSLAGNPVAGPTTAKVLAQFSDQTPAIATNELGSGKVLLLNWHATRNMSPAVVETLGRMLQQWKAPQDKAFIMDTAPNRARYGREALGAAASLLQKVGYRAKITPEDRLATLPPGSLLILPSVYLIPDDFATSLERFVNNGGLLIVLDGPVFAIRNASIQRVLGMSRTGKYINRFEVIQPVGKSDLLATRETVIDLDKERLRQQKWAEYRKAGVTELVRDVYRRAKQLKPKAQVTAAVFTPLASAESVFQDWPGWLREGIIDYVIPMAYTLKNDDLAKQMKEWQTVDPKLQRIIPGLSLYKRTETKAISREPELVLSQHQLSLDHGAPGNVYFCLSHLDQPISTSLVTKYYGAKMPAYHPPCAATTQSTPQTSTGK